MLGGPRLRIALMILIVPVATFAAGPSDRFSRDIAPILVKRCLECHSQREAAGKLVLSQKGSALTGGESGPAIVPGRIDTGELLARVTAGEMPPPKRGQSQKLPDAEIAMLKEWIAAGAIWPDARELDLYEVTSDVRAGRDWWSLQPVAPVAIPATAGNFSAATPIDAFVLARLTAAGLRPAPPADRATLIKRLSFDLIGLPPEYDDIQEFLGDPSPDACERLIDRLLASPHFGERWGRYWLDVVRYADTCGYERDQEKPYAWKYRDWVVQALNDDMPYDRFILEQLAGDELPDRTESTVVATGFLRLGTWNDEPNDADEYKYERLEDMVHATSTAFLALTVKCARCHDHKFDPIPQTDYYRMAAAFWPGAIDPRGRELLGGPTREELGYDVMGWTDLRQPPPLHLLKKGDHRYPQDVVEPGHLSVLATVNLPFEPPPLGARTTHRRRQLADWMASGANPLTPRVLVNRLWMNHFGEGLVRTADNFGFTGDKPTHPDLLDWLAREAMPDERSRFRHAFESGYTSMKRLHRLLVSSAAYRQASLHPEQDAYRMRDAGNHLWWHAQRRRLESEALRDRLLIVGNDLDTRMTGPGFKPTIQAEALEGLSRKEGAWKPSPPSEQRRRAVYLFAQRSLLAPLMTTFDSSDTTLPCVQRPVSTVAPQALALLNNAFTHERSQALAQRVLDEVPTAEPSDAASLLERRIVRAWQLALGRNPSFRESVAALQHIDQQRIRFENSIRERSASLPSWPRNGLVLHLSADTAVPVTSDGRVDAWKDQSGQGHHAAQMEPVHRPLLVKNAIGTRPALRFDGQRRFLHLSGQVLSSQSFAVFAVVSDRSTTHAHREIFSNWNGEAGNAVTSLFVGMTGPDAVRLSDDFSGVGRIHDRSRPFLLSAFNGRNSASICQNGLELASRLQPISPRNLQTNYVIGQQGNIDGEYWQGDVAEVLVYDRELNDVEKQNVTVALARKYDLPLADDRPSPQVLALGSLCHVLLNTNEFMYVD